MRALLYLDRYDGELTPSVICETHRILLNGAYDLRHGEHVMLAAGKYRVNSSYNGAWDANAYSYMAPESISDTVIHICEHYNNSPQPWIEKASYLLYSLLTCHPFENGNGRLARLFWWWSVKRSGMAPFPVMLSSAHNKAVSHYMGALHFADRHPGEDRLYELNSLAVGALARAWVAYRTQANLARDGSL